MKYSKGNWERLKTYLIQVGHIDEAYHKNYSTKITENAITGSGEIAIVFGKTLEESKTRARIILKAPEMYDALQSVCEDDYATSMTAKSTLKKIYSLLKELKS